MKRTYWVRFYAWDEGQGYTVDVPDLDCSTTEGDSWEEAVYMARDMITGYLEMCLRDGDPVPAPGSKDEVAALKVEADMGPMQLVEISVDIDDGQSLLPDGLWADLGKFSQKEGVPVDELLARAAREYLVKHQSNG